MGGEITRFDGWVAELLPSYHRLIDKMNDFDHGFVNLVGGGLFSFAYRVDLLLAHQRVRSTARSFLGGTDEVDQKDIARIRAVLAQLGKRNSDKFLTALRILALHTQKVHILMADERMSAALRYAELCLGSLGDYAQVDDDAAASAIKQAVWQRITGPYAASELFIRHQKAEATQRQQQRRQERSGAPRRQPRRIPHPCQPIWSRKWPPAAALRRHLLVGGNGPSATPRFGANWRPPATTIPANTLSPCASARISQGSSRRRRCCTSNRERIRAKRNKPLGTIRVDGAKR